jgi:hypothetical protein
MLWYGVSLESAKYEGGLPSALSKNRDEMAKKATQIITQFANFAVN